MDGPCSDENEDSHGRCAGWTPAERKRRDNSLHEQPHRAERCAAIEIGRGLMTGSNRSGVKEGNFRPPGVLPPGIANDDNRQTTATGGWFNRDDVKAIAALGIAIVCYFFPFIAGGQVFYQLDIAFMDHPVRVHAAEMMRGGAFPLWSDHILAGFPLFAEGQAAILYPPSWIYLVLPPEAALNVYIIGHYFFLGATFFFFLRRRPLSAPAALFGALSLVFCSFSIVEHVLIGDLSVIAWLPVLLWLGEECVRKSSGARIASAAAVVALMHLAGAPLATLLSLLLFEAWVLLGVSDEAAGTRDRARAAVLPVLLGTSLAAVQLLPTLEFFLESSRAGGGSFALPDRSFIGPEVILTTAFPSFFGQSLSCWFVPRISWEEFNFLYIGWAPAFLAILGYSRSRASVFWLAIAGAAIVLCLREFAPVSRLVWAIPPLGSFRWPARVMLWYALAMSALAASGFEKATNEVTLSDQRVRLFLLVLLAAFMGVLFWIFRLDFATPTATGCGSLDEILQVRHAGLVLFATVWGLLLATASLRSQDALTGTHFQIALFIALGIGIGATPRPGGVSAHILSEVPETARFLERHLKGARVLAMAPWSYRPSSAEGMAQAVADLPSNLQLRYGVRSVDQFDLASTTTLARSRDILSTPSPWLLDLLSVDAIITPAELVGASTYGWNHGPGKRPADELIGREFDLCLPGETRVYCRRDRRPRAFLTRNYAVVKRTDVVARLRDVPSDLRRQVWLDRPPSWQTTDEPEGVGPNEVGFSEDAPGRITLDVQAAQRSVLVLADTWYPGWKARVNGRDTEIMLAHGFIRAIAVPGGRSTVEMTFAPASFGFGIVVSLVALLILVGLSAHTFRSDTKGTR